MTIPDTYTKKDSIYKAWTRPTINWSLQCELDGFSRQEGYDIITKTTIDLDELNSATRSKTYGTWILILAFAGPICFCCAEGSPGGLVIGSVCGYVGNMILSCITLAALAHITKQFED